MSVCLNTFILCLDDENVWGVIRSNNYNPMCMNVFARNRSSDPFFEVCRPFASGTSGGVTWMVRYPAPCARVWVLV